MQFEYLIWIIIILFYVVLSVILKRVRAALKAGEEGVSKKRAGWKVKLDEFLSKARQEMKTAQKDGLKEKTGWENFLPQKDDELKSKQKQIPSERLKRVQEKMPSPKIKPAPVKAAVGVIESDVSPQKKLPKDLEYEIQDLRKAIIWSEILAPPLALRDEHQSF